MIKDKLDVNDNEVMRDFISTTESGMYAGKDVEGKDVVVFLDKEKGATFKYYQSNGWIRCIDYSAEGFNEGDYFEGRWSKQ